MDRARERLIDELLVIRCQAGDQEFFDLLVRRWQRRLWRYARRLTGSEDAAWDVVQETWMVILRQIRRLSDPAWFAVWVYRIVRNKCADYCRSASRQRGLVDAVAESPSADDEPLRDDSRAAVAAAVRRLPRDCQELLMLRYRADLNILELAAVLGIPAGTVKSRLYYAREQLRHILKGEDA
jgi:RNA polymerase sigma factor (sigma-70 family)